MAVYEDTMFVRALKLLHSPAKESTLQMMHLLEEVINQNYGVGTKTLNQKLHKLTEESVMSMEPSKARGSRGASPAVLILSEKSSRSSTPPSEPVSIRTSPDRDDGDLALEIFEDDLFCTVCKGMRVTSDNRLLECDGCHSLYHQECHNPPVDSDANDPRVVWSCGDCVKRKQEKISSKSASRKHKTDSDHSDSSGKKRDADIEPPPKKQNKSDKSSHKKSEKPSSSSSSKSRGSSKSSRSENRSSSSSSKSSGTNLNFNKQPGSPNGKSPSCTANIIAADKRLQNMKKKAAAKMQEKRK